ncbi:hypothetical protein OJE16_19030 [Pantoea tagorei]
MIRHTAPFRWAYDAQALKSCHYAANVAASVLQHLATLPLPTRHLLGKFATLGSAGELGVMSHILGKPEAEIERTLLPAAAAKLIALNGSEYAFMHDSMHEAALDLLEPADKDAFHYRAALHYMHQASLDVTNAVLFRAAHHLLSIRNGGLLAHDAQTFCRLMLKASRRAKDTGDYVSALRYLQTARLLNNGVEDDDQSEFLLEEAECEFLNGNLSMALALCSEIVASPGEVTEKAEAACLIAEIHMRQSDSKLALETALAWLAVFGIQLNRYPESEECDAARNLLKEAVGKNPYARFRALPLLNCKKN